jgi:hypothetical protein
MLNLVSYGIIRPREIAVRQKAVTDQAELRRNAPEQTRLMLLKPLPENASALFIRSGTVLRSSPSRPPLSEQSSHVSSRYRPIDGIDVN